MPIRLRRPRSGLVIAGATVLAVAGAVAVPRLASAAPDPGSPVKVNQVAYVPGLPKQATLVNSSTSPVPWTLRNAAGATVASGQSTVRGSDALSGDRLHVIDFSSFDTPGTGYVLTVAGANSYPFDISADPVKRLRYDSLAFFYHQRSGTPIEAQYAGSQYARPAGHVNVAPNQGDNNVACRQSCGYTLDVRGGWYDAGDHGKYVVNGGISTWQLLNAYERTLHTTGADRGALGDGRLAIPERANGVPDILDEARWEVEFLLKMQVPAGRTNAGMVHHKVHDENWTGLPTLPHADSQRRLLSPVSTAATLNMAAVAAQAARLWRTFDPTFASRALAAAERAYAAAKANPNRLAPASDNTGGGAYEDLSVTDEFYWAAAELYVTTGSAAYRSDVTGSSFYRGGSFSQRGYDWNWVGGLGDTTLAVVPNGLPAADIAATRSAITAFADEVLTRTGGQGYPAPNNRTAGIYHWGSNGQIANNANVIALAHDFTGQQRYRAGVYATLDYLLGRNPLNQSYISGYGDKAVRNVHHRHWANQHNSALPIAPPGALSGGPNSELQDPVAQQQLAGCAPQKCFVDHIDAYSVNEVTINWNSALAWLSNWAAEKVGGPPPADTTAPSTPGQPVASNVGATSVTLSRAAAPDPQSGVTGYDVLRVNGSTATVVASPTAPSATVTGLTADTAYSFAVVARNGAGLTSARSATVAVTTTSGTEDARPTAPGAPTASGVTATRANLSWPPATDDRGVAGYDVLRIQGSTQTTVASSTTTSATLTGLSPNTDHVFAVRARDTAGQLSGLSPTITIRTPAAATGGCTVSYSANNYSGGFTGSLALANTGSAAWTSWTLTFTFPGDQKVVHGWGGRFTQSGATVTVTNESWNGAVPAGGSVGSIGFNASHTGTNANPTTFTVNGTTC